MNALLALLLVAQAPVPPTTPVAAVSHPDVVRVGMPINLYADASVSSKPLAWRQLLGPKAPYTTYAQDDRKGVLLVMRNPPAGMYRFALIAIGDAPDAFDFAFADVVVLPQPTPPAPAPVPAPATVPVPAKAPPRATEAVEGPLSATLIFDLDDPSTAHLRASDVKDQLAALDCKWFVAATASPAARGYMPFVPSSGLPAAFVVDSRGRVILTVKAPVKPADVVAPIQAIRGVSP